MSKKFKNKDCAYCGAKSASTDGDHVFSREFFLERYRANLPKVPACKDCNRAKSVSEHYLLHAWPFAGRHADAVENFQTLLPKRRHKNHKLDSELYGSRKLIWHKEANGLIVPRGAYLIDANMVREWATYVAKGLTRYHWQRTLGSEYIIDANIPTQAGINVLLEFFSLDVVGSSIVDRGLGNGAVEYAGGHDGEMMVWLIQIYGGMTMSGDDLRDTADIVSVVARSKSVHERLQRTAKFWPSSMVARPDGKSRMLGL